MALTEVFDPFVLGFGRGPSLVLPARSFSASIRASLFWASRRLRNNFSSLINIFAATHNARPAPSSKTKTIISSRNCMNCQADANQMTSGPVPRANAPLLLGRSSRVRATFIRRIRPRQFGSKCVIVAAPILPGVVLTVYRPR